MNKIKFLAMALAVSSASFVAHADVDKDFSENYDFNSNGIIRVENINGNIEIEGWDKNEILLEYTISADDKDDLERIKVDVDSSSSKFSVDVDFSSKKKGWFGSWGSNSGEVDFRLKVPHDAVLKMIESVNGNISIVDVLGEIKADTVNGAITVEDAGSDVSTDTVNGDMKIIMKRFVGDQRIKADSVNGDIEVYLPDNQGFKLNVETINGDLSNDFGIEVDEGQYVGADMDGTYKNGKARLIFDTVNGDVEVKKR